MCCALNKFPFPSNTVTNSDRFPQFTEFLRHILCLITLKHSVAYRPAERIKGQQRLSVFKQNVAINGLEYPQI